MINNKRKLIAIALVVIVAISAAYAYRYYLLFYYYTYEAELFDKPSGKYLLGVGDNIIEIAPHIIPLLESIYKDVDEPELRRRAAAIGLKHADPERALILFSALLERGDDDVLANAIWNIADLDRGRYYEAVIKHKDSPNPRVRQAVKHYIGVNNGTEA